MGATSSKGMLQLCMILAAVTATEQFGMGGVPSSRMPAEPARRIHTYRSSTCVFAPRRTDQETETSLPAKQGRRILSPRLQGKNKECPFTEGSGEKVQDVIPVAKPAVNERTAFDKDGVLPADQSTMMQKGLCNMKSLYHESDRALFVFYHKKGCSICSVFQPILERVIKEYSACDDALHYVSLDIHEEEGIHKRAGITGVPATQVYYKGKLLDMVPGVHSKKWLRKHINGILEAYGEPHVREWAHERLVATRKEEFYTSTIFRKAVEALKDGHVQQVRMQAPSGIAGWQGLGARGRGALGECSAVCSAVCDGERNNVRKFLPAFQPAAKPAWENCIDSCVIEMT